MKAARTLRVGVMTTRPIAGWQADATGAINTAGAVSSITIPTGSSMIGQPSSTVTYSGNLDSATLAAGTLATTVPLYDSLGVRHDMTLTFTKAATANTWNFAYTTADPSVTIGAGATVDQSNRIVLGRISGDDTVRVPGSMSVGGNFFAADTWLGDTQVQGSFKFQAAPGGAATPICGSGNGSGAYTLSFCASSARYKTDVRDFTSGLSLIRELRPVSFRWKETNEEDLGFVAEEVAEFEPRLAILDETDSGLDIDALKLVANGVNAMRAPDRAFIVVTHYQRLLTYIVPDFVHVLSNGRIVKSGGKELALELEAKGYSWIDADPVLR